MAKATTKRKRPRRRGASVHAIAAARARREHAEAGARAVIDDAFRRGIAPEPVEDEPPAAS